MRRIGYEELIGTKTEEKLFCKICGLEFEEPKAHKKAKKHCRERCKTRWVVLSEAEFNTLYHLLISLMSDEDYKSRLDNRTGLGILYSMNNPLTKDEAVEYL